MEYNVCNECGSSYIDESEYIVTEQEFRNVFMNHNCIDDSEMLALIDNRYIKLYVNLKYDIGGSTITAIHIACYNGHSKVVTRLLKYGANGGLQTHLGSTPLHFAISGVNRKNVTKYVEYIDIIKILCDYGVDTNVLNNRGKRPIDLLDSSLLPDYVYSAIVAMLK
jgi:ankyrin repeat protein